MSIPNYIYTNNLQEYRTFRASLFVGLGITSASPIIHLIKDNGLAYVVERGALYHALIMGALYITGACLYAARIPERFMPGKCDIWFQSHQVIILFSSVELILVSKNLQISLLCIDAYYETSIFRFFTFLWQLLHSCSTMGCLTWPNIDQCMIRFVQNQ